MAMFSSIFPRHPTGATGATDQPKALPTQPTPGGGSSTRKTEAGSKSRLKGRTTKPPSSGKWAWTANRRVKGSRKTNGELYLVVGLPNTRFWIGKNLATNDLYSRKKANHLLGIFHQLCVAQLLTFNLSFGKVHWCELSDRKAGKKFEEPLQQHTPICLPIFNVSRSSIPTKSLKFLWKMALLSKKKLPGF